jgi:tetrahydromethanopterin S-methyltransferase subunit E
LKKFTKQVINEKSGFRFRRSFVYMRRKYGKHWGVQFGLILLGIILILAGIVMIVTPGPGWISILAGVIVIGCVSYPLARNMDKAEKHVVNKYQKFRNRKKNEKKS